MPVAETRLECLQICKLLQCVREADFTQIEKLSHNGVPHLINYNDPSDGHTALSIAATTNNDVMIEFLLGLGAHPDVVDFKGRTAAMRAAEYGHVQCLEKLAKAGANMQLTDTQGKGILFYCISPTQRHEKCFEIAVTHGAEVNNKAKDGTHVLLFACETAIQNERMCMLMLMRGSDANAKNEKSGITALMAACESGSWLVCKTILEHGGEVNSLDVRRNHASHYACKGGYFDVLKCLSAYNADFAQLNNEGNTPIHITGLGGHAMCCKYLSQRGCNPKPKNNDGETARSLAKEANHKEIQKELRKSEKSFGKVVKNGEPWAILLYDWALERNGLIVDMFTKYDPDDLGAVNKDDFVDCLNALKAPIEEEELQKIVALHDKGKDGKIDYGDFLGAKKYINKNYLMSAFDGKKKKKKKGKKGGKKGKFKLVMPICTLPENENVVSGGPDDVFIVRQIPFTDTGRFNRDRPPIHPLQDDSAWYLNQPERSYININESAKLGDMNSLKSALQKGTQIDTRDKYYKTPLMAACSSGNVSIAKYLVENGAEIMSKDNFKWTSLHHACHAGQLDIVEYLVDCGADINATAMNGGTPLTRAIESSKIDVVQFLLMKGAKLQTENKKGHTPMDVAIAWADLRVLDIVQSKWDNLTSDKKKGGAAAKKGAAATPGKGKRPLSGEEGTSKSPQTV